MNRNIPIQAFRAEAFIVQVRQIRPAEKRRSKNPRLAKIKMCCAVLASAPLLFGCASPPLALAPVGPGPGPSAAAAGRTGALQVYSEPEEYCEEDLCYFPHTDYQLYSSSGKYLRRIWNHTTHEDETPATVSLEPGQYEVRAWAQAYGVVRVPVVIKAKELTEVILQPGWNPGAGIANSALVQMPQGYFIGWRAELAGAR